MDTFPRGIEKRKQPRIPVMMQVYFTDGEEFLVDYSTNLGPGGIFINTHHRFDADKTIHMKFVLPGYDQPVRVQGKVKWTNNQPASLVHGSLPGIGVQFIDANDHAGEAISHFVERFLPTETQHVAEKSDGASRNDWNRFEDLYDGQLT